MMVTSENPNSMGTVTREIAVLLPAVNRGEKWAIDQIVTIAHDRLIQLIRGKKARFAPGIAQQNYRGDEQTGHILGELYERLRRAVEAKKFSELQHPAGFWKIAADHVMYILLDLARERKTQRDRLRGPRESASDESALRSSDENGSRLGASAAHGGGGGSGAGGRGAAAAADDSQVRGEPGREPLDPIQHVADHRHESAEFYLLRQEVLEAIGQLEEPHQTVLSMYYYLGATQREIAEILPHLHERKVGRIIDQAEEKLRGVLGEGFLD